MSNIDIECGEASLIWRVKPAIMIMVARKMQMVLRLVVLATAMVYDLSCTVP